MVLRSKFDNQRGLNAVPVLTFCNQKGGTGKTTLTQIAIPYCAEVQGLRVGVIDCDPQCNLTLRYLVGRRNEANTGWIPPPHPFCGDLDFEMIFKNKDYSSICDIWKLGASLPYDTVMENVSIFPNDGKELSSINKASESKEIKIIDKFKEHIALMKNSGLFDIIIIDTPPNQYAVAQGAIASSTDCFAVAIPETKSVEGLVDVMAMFNSLNDTKLRSEDQIDRLGHTTCRGVIFNKYDYKSRTVHDNTINWANSGESGFASLILKNHMAERVDLKFIDMHGADPTNPFAYPKSQAIYKESMSLFDEIWTTMGFEHTDSRKDFDPISLQANAGRVKI